VLPSSLEQMHELWVLHQLVLVQIKVLLDALFEDQNGASCVKFKSTSEDNELRVILEFVG